MKILLITAANAAAIAVAAFFYATTVSHYGTHPPACASHQTPCTHGAHVVVTFGTKVASR